MIKINEVAFLKTTSEPVFVLEITGEVVAVRRPVQGRDGIGHVVNQFSIHEIETAKESATRQLAEQKMRFGMVNDEPEVIEPATPSTKAN